MSKASKVEYERKWRQANAERVKGYKRKHYLKNMEAVKVAARKWKQSHPEYAKSYSIKNRKYLREYGRKRYREHPEKTRMNTWRGQGIDMAHWSYAQYCDMFKAQRGKCRGCGCSLALVKTEGISKYAVAAVDHNHHTGRVRGLLCGFCNDACGKAKDSPKILRRLASYLDGHSRRVLR